MIILIIVVKVYVYVFKVFFLFIIKYININMFLKILIKSNVDNINWFEFSLGKIWLINVKGIIIKWEYYI